MKVTVKLQFLLCSVLSHYNIFDWIFLDSYLVVTAQKVTAQQAIFLRKILPPKKEKKMLKTLIFLSSVRSLLMTLQFLNGLKHSYSEQQPKEHMNNSRSSGYTFISVITRQIGNGMAKTGGGGYQMKVSSPPPLIFAKLFVYQEIQDVFPNFCG